MSDNIEDVQQRKQKRIDTLTDETTFSSQQAVIWVLYESGFTQAEIGEHLGNNQRQVATQLARAREKIGRAARTLELTKEVSE